MPPPTSSTVTPATSPVQEDLVPERGNTDAAPGPSLKGKEVVDGDSTRQVVNPSNARPSSAFEGVDLSDINEMTLNADFQVGQHVSLFPFVFLLFRRVRDQRSRWE